MEEGVAKFFDHGEVRLVKYDVVQRQALLSVTAPYCLVHIASRALLFGGTMDNMTLHQPLVVWSPGFNASHIKIEGVADPEGVARKITDAVQKSVVSSLALFAGYSTKLLNPVELSTILPIGTYVTFRYRCTPDKFIVSLTNNLETVENTNEHEFKQALINVMSYSLDIK